MANIQQYKIDATLNKVFRYNEGVMSRKEWLNMQRIKGSSVIEEVRRNYSAEEKLQSWLDSEKLRVPFGNPNYPTTAHYLREKARLESGIYKTVYRLKSADKNSFWDITKTEYDYFLNMQLAEDLATDKHDLSNRIEAGTATEQEIADDMAKEFDFFGKYFNS